MNSSSTRLYKIKYFIYLETFFQINFYTLTKRGVSDIFHVSRSVKIRNVDGYIKLCRVNLMIYCIGKNTLYHTILWLHRNVPTMKQIAAKRLRLFVPSQFLCFTNSHVKITMYLYDVGVREFQNYANYNFIQVIKYYI